MKKHHSSKTFKEIQSCGIGIFASLTAMAVFAVVIALCIENEYLYTENTTYGIVIMQFLACLLGGVVARRVGGDKKLMAIAVPAAVLALQIIVAFLFFGGVSAKLWWVLFATCAAAGVCYFLSVARAKRGTMVRKMK